MYTQKLTPEQQESKRLDGETVFSASHSEIAQTRVTQCTKHAWYKLDDENLACTKCPTAVRVSADYLKELLKH